MNFWFWGLFFEGEDLVFDVGEEGLEVLEALGGKAFVGKYIVSWDLFEIIVVLVSV